VHGTGRLSALLSYFSKIRRTVERKMVRSGVRQSVAMKISRHKTASMFRRYDVANEDDLRQAMLNLKKYHEAERKKVAPAGDKNQLRCFLPFGDRS
jgi:hypothetical protein